MRNPKALLPYGGATFSRSILTALIKGGTRPMVVVGHDPGPIVAHLCDLAPQFVLNSKWRLGQLSSLQAALRWAKGADAVLVALVDQPGLRPGTVRRLIREHRRDPAKILVASYRGRSGHPVLFPRRFFRELLNAPPSVGARSVVQNHLEDRRIIPTTDPAVVRDVDTPAGYASL